MSLKPKHRLGGRTSLDITGYTESYNEIKIDSRASRKETILQRIRWKQLAMIYFVFIIVIHYFERTKPYYTIKSCMWNNWESWEKGALPHHSIIIGDPQIVDEYSYPSRSSLGLGITKILSDNYLHRNHAMYNKILKPDSIVFVGDLFDGGREWNDTQWMQEYVRFNKIFNPVEGVRQFRQVPGNHDVGFGNGIEFERYSRFKAFFGNADEVVSIGNHSLVLMDTVSLSCTEDKRVSTNSEKFLNSFKDPNNPYMEYPRVLISHVPFYRFNDIQSCGPLRESNKLFPVMRGKQYQTVIEYELSQTILNTIRPSILFTGDDHDYCHIRHPLDKSFSRDISDFDFKKGDHPGVKYTDEVTVKSSAMTGGIKKPAIQLLSLWNPENKKENSWKVKNDPSSKTVDSETASTHLCYLPNPYQPLLHYGILLGCSLLWILVCTVFVEYGHRLHVSFQKYALKSKKIIERIFKKDINSIDLAYLQKKRNNRFERAFEYIILDWDIERQKDWKSFALNACILVILVISTILWYFRAV